MLSKNADRTTAFGQSYDLTWVDRWGIWLSSRQVHRFIRDFAGKAVGDFGCGYQATLGRALAGIARELTLIDVSLAPDVKQDPRIRSIEGSLPEVLSAVESGGGVCLINVPSWRGKGWLEFSAFRLRLSPREEIDDHKCYYDPNELWPLLVSAGFRPSSIRCFRHKFGLNTFAVCGRG